MGGRELEICVETLQACGAAGEGGADRVELCAALGEGGVTPSRGMLRAAVASSAVPVHALLRPRAGDFVYSAAEFGVMCADLEDALEAGAAGVVLGLLTAVGEIDRVRTAELVRRAQGRPVTFHRAFDHTRDLGASLEVLVDVGCARVLTSGGRPTVMEGFGVLEGLAARAAGRLRVAAGGGVRLENARELLRIAGLDLHASLLGRREGSGDPLWAEEGAGRVLSVASVRTLGGWVRAG